jgi:hypothetical protein
LRIGGYLIELSSVRSVCGGEVEVPAIKLYRFPYIRLPEKVATCFGTMTCDT